ncbi:unnamed protein product [Caenorhabditis nigoni]
MFDPPFNNTGPKHPQHKLEYLKGLSVPAMFRQWTSRGRKIQEYSNIEFTGNAHNAMDDLRESHQTYSRRCNGKNVRIVGFFFDFNLFFHSFARFCVYIVLSNPSGILINVLLRQRLVVVKMADFLILLQLQI